MIDPLIHTDINTQCWPMADVFHYFVLKSRLRSVSTIRYMLTAYIAYMVCLNLSSLLGDNIGVHIIFCPVGKRYRGIVKNTITLTLILNAPVKSYFLSTSQKNSTLSFKDSPFLCFLQKHHAHSNRAN